MMRAKATSQCTEKPKRNKVVSNHRCHIKIYVVFIRETELVWGQSGGAREKGEVKYIRR